MLFANVLPEMLRAEYWLRPPDQPQQPLLTPAEIAIYNQQILRTLPEVVYDLTGYPTFVSKSTLESWIQPAVMPAFPLFLASQPLEADYFEDLRARINLEALQEVNAVRYGITLCRTRLRTFPANDLVLEDPDRPEFDRFQETAINPAEPVVILHQSRDGSFYFIQTVNYRGWVAAETIGLTDKAVWLEYCKQPDFLIVTGSHLKIPNPATGIEWFFEMGAKIPLAAPLIPGNTGFLVQLPVADRDHQLRFIEVAIPGTTEVNPGYLPYTRANILKQAFKLYGQPYDWGGLHQSVDCSGFIMDVYRCFGLAMPRNSGEQAALPGPKFSLESMSTSEKINKLRQLPPGALLHLPGHVMMYLGENNGSLYIIHALSSYGLPDAEGNIQKIYHLQVAVTDLLLLRANGQTFLDTLTSATQLELA